MATESPVRIGDGIRASSSSSPTSSSSRDAVHELNLLVRERSRLAGSSDMHLHRSESAPPTVQGSLAAMEELFGAQLGGLGGGGGGAGHRHLLNNNDQLFDDDDDDTLLDAREQELRSDPAYYAYYHSHVNLNPRLPPPLKSWDNWRLANRTQLNSRLRSFDDHYMSANNSSSLFSASSQHLLPTHKEEPEHLLDDTLEQLLLRHTSSASASDGGYGMGRPKSLVDLIQEDFPRTPSPVYNQSRSSSRAANEDGTDPSAALDVQLGHLRDMSAAAVGSRSVTPNPNTVHHMFNDVHEGPDVRSSRSATPNPLSAADAATCSSSDSSSPPEAGISAAFKNLTINQSDDILDDEQHQHQQQHTSRSKQDQHSRAGVQTHVGYSHHHHQHNQQQQQHPPYKFGQQTSPTSNAYAAAAAAAAMSYIAAGNPYYHNLQSASVYPPHYGLAGYPLLPHHPMMAAYPPAPPLAFDTMAATMAARGGIPPDLHQYYKLTGQMPSTLQDALYLQYLRASEDARAAAVLSDMRSYAGAHSPDTLDSHQLFSGLNTKSQFSRGGVPVPGKAVPPGAPFYGSPPGLGFSVPFPNSPLPSPGLPSSPVGPSLRRDDHQRGNVRLTTGTTGGSRVSGYAGWPTPAGSDSGDEARGSLLLEEFKNSKNRRFELSDIVGHVVEFSADQHGSRFIQQKLESASPEEKAMVFQEVFPHCVTLMTDVFGNYVIQKFFEHGTPQQRKELAGQLVTRVLTLSLQMYGCRVIQKALEVVDVEQQIQLVSELDGHVMRCVRDQNGNHVIQKCIECVRPDRIQFIISAFYGQVVALSTHPYGCRVIQRVLERCTDEQKQQGIMQEILRSTCSLAQDQYGNYVVQHVLEHGTQPERSEIITKLAGQIVQMSQHKFASNVIEKCLEFGGLAERQILINEMLGSTDENEPLQAMMKDQFANYVVQKVLEICDDQQREILLTRIKVHLHALKKYTYGKHIVARVEKLVAAGERRSAVAAAHLSCDKQ